VLTRLFLAPDTNAAIRGTHRTGYRTITGLITPTRMVCANTQRAALSNARSSFKIRHTDSADDRVQQAREQLGLTWKYVAEFEVEAEKMIQETLAVAEFRRICDQIWTPLTDTATDRSKTIVANRTTALARLFSDADTNDEIRGTRWAGYQAVTEYLDHAAPVHGKTVGDKAVNRALRSIDGSVVDTKEKAFALLSVDTLGQAGHPQRRPACPAEHDDERTDRAPVAAAKRFGRVADGAAAEAGDVWWAYGQVLSDRSAAVGDQG
jgi:hypothetical protein